MSAGLRQPMRDERGFTLVEVLVTMLMMLTVMFALYSIFDMSLRVFSFGNDKTEAVQNARLGLERMEREIRVAYPYDKVNGDETLFPSYSSSTSGSITFGNDTNGNRSIVGDEASEEITYDVNGSTLERTVTGTSSQPVVEFVEDVDGDGRALTFEFLDSDGDLCDSSNANCSDESQIQVVSIKLEIDASSDGEGTQTLTTDVALRNRSE